MLAAIQQFFVAPTSVGATLLIGLIAAVVAVWGIVTQRALARRRATLDHLANTERDQDMIKARKQFIELAKQSGGLAKWADAENEGTEEAQSIRITLNDFELISIAIQKGIIDFDMYRMWNRTSVIRYWKNGSPYISALRARLNNRAIYHEFEEMEKWMQKDKMPKRNHWRGKWT
ncbi:MAG: DUF4760 domain-containing protein [Bosea sp. (in: a-proteobacteria)]